MTNANQPTHALELARLCPAWQIDWRDELSSTNRYAAEFVERYRTPAVLVADRQTFGRGRGRNTWSSQAGALTFSLILKPESTGFPREQRGLSSLLAAAAVCRVVREWPGIPREEVQLKWPNDLYLRGKKVCGILLEQPAVSPDCLVVGIGLNVNNSCVGMPEELQNRAISLCEVTGEPLDRVSILSEILLTWERVLADSAFRQELFPRLWQRIHLLDDRIVTIEQSDRGERERVVGRCLGIDEEGALRVQDTWAVQRIFSGNVANWE